MRFCLLLGLLFADAALADGTSTVRIRCSEECTVTVDGRPGLRVSPRQWEFEGVPAGQRRVEIVAAQLKRPLYSGYADVPAGAEVGFVSDRAKRLTQVELKLLNAGVPSEPSPAPVEALPGQGPSVVVVRCPEDCTVSMDGQVAKRVSPREWKFDQVPGGKRRADVKGLLGRPLFGGFVEVPSGASCTYLVDQSKRMILLNQEPQPGPAPSPAPDSASPPSRSGDSVLHVRCDRPCTVYVDGLRRAGDPQGATVRGLSAGAHQVEAKSKMSEVLGRGRVEVPQGMEVFVVASRNELKVTNQRPLTEGGN